MFDMKGEMHDILIENINATDIEIPVMLRPLSSMASKARLKTLH
jgi:hypothetical protein